MLYRVPIFRNNSKAKLVVTVSQFLFTVKYKASVGLCVEKQFLLQISENTCLQCILLPSTLQFLKISRSSKDKKHKDEGGQEAEGQAEVDGKR